MSKSDTGTIRAGRAFVHVAPPTCSTCDHWGRPDGLQGLVAPCRRLAVFGDASEEVCIRLLPVGSPAAPGDCDAVLTGHTFGCPGHSDFPTTQMTGI